LLPRWLIQLLAVALKELRHTVRDKRMMAILLIAPAVQLGVFGFAVDFDVDRVPTVVVDHDQSGQSRYHLQRILADGTLVQRMTTTSDAEAEKAIDSGEVAAALIVPPGFSDDLVRGRGAHLQVLVDGTDPNRGSIAAATVARYARGENQATAARVLNGQKNSLRVGPALDPLTTPVVLPQVPDVVMLPRVLHNPRLRTCLYMGPGIIALLLLVVTVIITSMGLARERETGTLEQVMVTPMNAVVLLVGKLLPYVAIGLFDFIFAIVVATRLFDVPIRGQLSVALLGTTAYVFCTLGVGLLISTVSRTQQQAFLGGFLFLLPTLLLSGVMTPLWGMPSWLLPVTKIIPVKYYGEIIRGVLLRGSTLADLSFHFGVLVVEGVLVLGFAAWRFHRSLG
jgi:ABC-2 type transport system permease protein